MTSLAERLFYESRHCQKEYESIFMEACVEIQKLERENQKLRADVAEHRCEKIWKGY